MRTTQANAYDLIVVVWDVLGTLVACDAAFQGLVTPRSKWEGPIQCDPCDNGPRLNLSEEIPPELHKQFHPKEINVYVLVRAGRDLTWTFRMKRPGFYISTKGVSAQLYCPLGQNMDT